MDKAWINTVGLKSVPKLPNVKWTTTTSTVHQCSEVRSCIAISQERLPKRPGHKNVDLPNIVHVICQLCSCDHVMQSSSNKKDQEPAVLHVFYSWMVLAFKPSAEDLQANDCRRNTPPHCFSLGAWLDERFMKAWRRPGIGVCLCCAIPHISP